MKQTAPNKKLNQARGLLSNLDFAQALRVYEELIRQFPNKTSLWLEYGVAAGRAGQWALADQIWNKALAIEPDNHGLPADIGLECQRLRQPEKARLWYEKAAAADPKGIDCRMGLAIVAEQNHQFAGAHAAIDSCLSIDPLNDQARYFAAFLDRRENKLEDAERRLRDLIASDPQHAYVKYSCRYELAEVLNLTGRFDEAMQMLREAKEIVRGYANIEEMLREYDQEAEHFRRSTRQLPKDILRAWARQFPEKSRGAMPKLAFLGGHPRSGTTLLEQVIGAHPDVAALDEPASFSTIACKLFVESPQLSAPRLNIIRRRYMEGLQREFGASFDGKLVVDKNPSPTARLRIWLRLFPELRVLIALRDPRDVVISCYFQNIALTHSTANFLTLERTARHYADLMDVWLAAREWEGLAWIETRYEDIVSDLEKEGRRVTEFLGLTWNEAQKRYPENGARIQMFAPTYHDAVQPVYQRSVGRWRAYEKHLAAALPILEPYCRALGYD